jgi:hypothetical protein
MSHVYLSLSPENIITVLLIVIIGYGLFSLAGQLWQNSGFSFGSGQ